ncbi:MAG TPA: hypothetical protein VKA18_08420 [Alphaproteobacteria bacterium]|nr:hypothetical protein [Alphaproteobacteria bacterium]
MKQCLRIHVDQFDHASFPVPIVAGQEQVFRIFGGPWRIGKLKGGLACEAVLDRFQVLFLAMENQRHAFPEVHGNGGDVQGNAANQAVTVVSDRCDPDNGTEKNKDDQADQSQPKQGAESNLPLQEAIKHCPGLLSADAGSPQSRAIANRHFAEEVTRTRALISYRRSFRIAQN